METPAMKLPTTIRNGVLKILDRYMTVKNSKESRKRIYEDVWSYLREQHSDADATFKVDVSGCNNFGKKHGWRHRRSYHEVNVNITMNDARVWFTIKDAPPTLMYQIVTTRGLALSKNWQKNNKIDDQFDHAMKGI